MLQVALVIGKLQKAWLGTSTAPETSLNTWLFGYSLRLSKVCGETAMEKTGKNWKRMEITWT
jgi:hypothetical protein